MIIKSLRYVYRESGLASVFATGVDAWIIILARSCRMFAYGASALVLALFFAELDVSDARIGLFMTLTLAGDVGLSLLLTLVADHVGRRRTLMFGSVLMVMSGTTFALSENYWLLLLAAVAGVISATGGDFGPFRAVEESMLSEVTNPATRADVLVWYVTTSALGSAVGTEVAGRVVHYLHNDSDAGGRGWSLRQAYHACYWAYAAMGVLNLVLSLLLSKKSELQHRALDEDASVPASNDIPLSSRPSSRRTPQTPTTPATPGDAGSGSGSANDDSEEGSLAERKADEEDDRDSLFSDDENQALTHLPSSATSSSPGTPPPTGTRSAKAPGRFSQISSKTRSIMYGLWFLLMVDSLADGMASIALTSYYLDSKFHMSKDSLGNILSISYLLAACSSVFAGPLSRYIGLINTMVFTHVPSSAAVLLFPLPSSIGLTYALLLLRIGLNNLDQAPRAALIAAVVRPEERTAVLGITSLLRTLASTTGPTVTGFLAGSGRFWIAFVVAGALRLAYDFGLFAMFVNIRLYQYEPTQPVEAPRADTNGGYSSVPGHPDTFVLDEEESIDGEIQTTQSTVIGTPLIDWPDNDAATLTPPANQTRFRVAIPALGDKCTTAGTCVLQWHWLGQGQTYEWCDSCVDFTTPKTAAKMFKA